MKRRAVICAGVVPAALPLAALAFRFEADRGASACATPEALREAHGRHALTPPQRKMMEEGAICPICGCPPGLPPQPAKLRR
ncbi:MAG: hypothetical protein V4653_13060 [Pseudomonadota bacterium]